jgi:hypothetical protein
MPQTAQRVLPTPTPTGMPLVRTLPPEARPVSKVPGAIFDWYPLQ